MKIFLRHSFDRVGAKYSDVNSVFAIKTDIYFVIAYCMSISMLMSKFYNKLFKRQRAFVPTI